MSLRFSPDQIAFLTDQSELLNTSQLGGRSAAGFNEDLFTSRLATVYNQLNLRTCGTSTFEGSVLADFCTYNSEGGLRLSAASVGYSVKQALKPVLHGAVKTVVFAFAASAQHDPRISVIFVCWSELHEFVSIVPGELYLNVFAPQPGQRFHLKIRHDSWRSGIAKETAVPMHKSTMLMRNLILACRVSIADLPRIDQVLHQSGQTLPFATLNAPGGHKGHEWDNLCKLVKVTEDVEDVRLMSVHINGTDVDCHLDLLELEQPPGGPPGAPPGGTAVHAAAATPAAAADGGDTPPPGPPGDPPGGTGAFWRRTKEQSKTSSWYKNPKGALMLYTNLHKKVAAELKPYALNDNHLYLMHLGWSSEMHRPLDTMLDDAVCIIGAIDLYQRGYLSREGMPGRPGRQSIQWYPDPAGYPDSTGPVGQQGYFNTNPQTLFREGLLYAVDLTDPRLRVRTNGLSALNHLIRARMSPAQDFELRRVPAFPEQEGILPRDGVLFTAEEREQHYQQRMALQAANFEINVM